jgi:hypothetical protein
MLTNMEYFSNKSESYASHPYWSEYFEEYALFVSYTVLFRVNKIYKAPAQGVVAGPQQNSKLTSVDLRRDSSGVQ